MLVWDIITQKVEVYIIEWDITDQNLVVVLLGWGMLKAQGQKIKSAEWETAIELEEEMVAMG